MWMVQIFFSRFYLLRILWEFGDGRVSVVKGIVSILIVYCENTLKKKLIDFFFVPYVTASVDEGRVAPGCLTGCSPF